MQRTRLGLLCVAAVMSMFAECRFSGEIQREQETAEARENASVATLAAELEGTSAAVAATADAERSATAAFNETATHVAELATLVPIAETLAAFDAQRTATARANLAVTSAAYTTEVAAATAEAARRAFLTLIELPDPPNDAVDCVSRALLGAQTAPVVDIRGLTLSSASDQFTLRLVVSQTVDLNAEIGNSLYLVGIGIHDPAFPLPPVDPAVPYSGLANQGISVARVVASQPFTASAANFRDGAWTSTNPPDMTAVVQANIIELTAPTAFLPQVGTLYVYATLRTEQCDDLNPSAVPGEVIHFERTEAGLGFRVGPLP